ncbi:MAG: protein-L-isoaspartate(D-aspartate) O-methyltransferase [Acidiferrobacterales bacterium]
MRGHAMKERDRMVREIEAETRSTSRWIGKKALDKRVMAAIGSVPRHEFVPSDVVTVAYRNEPLPIGFGQTISQPYIVALMTDLLRPDEQDIVLEVGTGCGYQTAVLGELFKQVYTVEVVKELGEQAQTRLTRQGYDNVKFKIGDGYYGWREHAPYDAIIVTAAARNIPDSLIEQLRPGGRMAIPVGTPNAGQTLMQVEKDKAGNLHSKDILPVAFVPITGRH